LICKVSSSAEAAPECFYRASIMMMIKVSEGNEWKVQYNVKHVNETLLIKLILMFVDFKRDWLTASHQ